MLPETRYAYSVARVRVTELNMLTKSRLERMLDSDRISTWIGRAGQDWIQDGWIRLDRNGGRSGCVGSSRGS